MRGNTIIQECIRANRLQKVVKLRGYIRCTQLTTWVCGNNRRFPPPRYRWDIYIDVLTKKGRVIGCGVARLSNDIAYETLEICRHEARAFAKMLKVVLR